MQSVTKFSFEEELVALKEAVGYVESIRQLSMDIQTLIEHGNFSEARKQLITRGERIDTLVTLNQQVENFLIDCKNNDSAEREEIRSIVLEFQKLMLSVIGLNEIVRNNLDKEIKQISLNLNELCVGRKLVKGYMGSIKKNDHTLQHFG